MTDITGALAKIEEALQEGMTLDDISYDDAARKRTEQALSLITAIRKAVVHFESQPIIGCRDLTVEDESQINLLYRNSATLQQITEEET